MVNGKASAAGRSLLNDHRQALIVLWAGIEIIGILGGTWLLLLVLGPSRLASAPAWVGITVSLIYCMVLAFALTLGYRFLGRQNGRRLLVATVFWPIFFVVIPMLWVEDRLRDPDRVP